MDKVLTRENLNSIGIIGVLGLIVVAWLNGTVVSGKDYQKEVAEKEKWMNLTINLLEEKKNNIPNIIGMSPEKVDVLNSVPFSPEDVKKQIEIMKNE